MLRKKTRVLISLLCRMRGAIEGTGGPWTPNNFIWAKPQTPISPKTTIRPTYFFPWRPLCFIVVQCCQAFKFYAFVTLRGVYSDTTQLNSTELN